MRLPTCLWPGGLCGATGMDETAEATGASAFLPDFAKNASAWCRGAGEWLSLKPYLIE